MPSYVKLRGQLVVYPTCCSSRTSYRQRPPAGAPREPQAANNQTRPSRRCRTKPRLPCGTSWLMSFLPLEASRDAGFGRRRPYLVAVHRLSLGLREQLQEEDKEEGEGVVRTTRRSMSLH